ncbi:MAG: DUF1858 domain-containing protein [Nitrospinae bacterium]|nr:DUF1858 domain-containing protein [Nitrospinota bacterium]MBL7019005.1 DUF1858 domain-containing protein [Nitrospinaceae bacterium]
MDNTPRLFIKAGLIYAVIGALLGITMAINPSLSHSLRFIHIHLNLLGFMTMMVSGVAYHVLPRFSARTLPWPAGMKYQFILQNVGLIGMAVVQGFDDWRGGGMSQLFFIFFAALAGISFVIMFYNLYFVLSPEKEEPRPTKITGDMKVGPVIDQFPKALEVFIESGFQALANPAARQTFARVISIDKACEKHGVPSVAFLEKLNQKVFAKEASSDSPTHPEGSPAAGQEIERGKMCEADTRVGSLIVTYPTSKKVFEAHYGEGCFSCPGQVFETVEQTASMHNVDLKLILPEINSVIEKELKTS